MVVFFSHLRIPPKILRIYVQDSSSGDCGRRGRSKMTYRLMQRLHEHIYTYFVYLKLEISKSSLICFVSAIRSLLARVSTLLSSITVLSDSIHMGSMSPSKINHFGPSPGIFAWSRISTETKLKHSTTFHSNTNCSATSYLITRLSILWWQD